MKIRNLRPKKSFMKLHLLVNAAFGHQLDELLPRDEEIVPFRQQDLGPML
jgi:hypothetical protein